MTIGAPLESMRSFFSLLGGITPQTPFRDGRDLYRGQSPLTPNPSNKGPTVGLCVKQASVGYKLGPQLSLRAGGVPPWPPTGGWLAWITPSNSRIGAQLHLSY